MDNFRLSNDGMTLEWVRDNIEHLEIPFGVKNIKDYVFYENTSLVSIVIPNSVSAIGQGAFAKCTSLKSIVIPDGITEIADFTFQDCKSLEILNIPKNLKKIGSFAFSGTKWLEEKPNGEVYINNILCYYKGDVKESPLIVKDGTVSITGGAFYRCTSLKSIVIPNSVRHIGIGAFNFCTSLERIELPNKLTEICQGTFSGCTSLKSIDIPNSVIEIGGGAFSGCTSLKSIDIPHSVTTIDDNAFSDCASIESIDIPNSLEYIGAHAFAGCISLHRIIIPSSIRYIGDYALERCPLFNILVNTDNPIYYSKNDILYKRMKGDKNILVKYAPMINGDTFFVDKSTIKLDGSAFMGAKKIKEIVLHDDITEFGGRRIFSGCTSLRTIRLPARLKVIPLETFANCYSLETVYLPNSENYRIWMEAFKGCVNLKEIHSQVENIDNIIIHNEAFDGFDLYNCTLYVPSGTRWAYRHHNGFGKFKNIEIEERQ